MPQVSKYPLNKTTETRLYQLFWETVSNLKDASKAKEFFTDLLTPTEKIMLSKRLAIAVMLIKGYDYSFIKSLLRVSPTTIGSVSLWLKYSGSGYRKVVERLARKEKFEDVLEGIESAAEIFIPEKTFPKTLAKGFPKGKYKEPF